MDNTPYFSTSPLTLGGSDTTPSTGGVIGGEQQTQIPTTTQGNPDSFWNGNFGTYLNTGANFAKYWNDSSNSAALARQTVRQRVKLAALQSQSQASNTRLLIIGVIVIVALFFMQGFMRRK